MKRVFSNLALAAMALTLTNACGKETKKEYVDSPEAVHAKEDAETKLKAAVAAQKKSEEGQKKAEDDAAKAVAAAKAAERLKAVAEGNVEKAEQAKHDLEVALANAEKASKAADAARVAAEAAADAARTKVSRTLDLATFMKDEGLTFDLVKAALDERIAGKIQEIGVDATAQKGASGVYLELADQKQAIKVIADKIIATEDQIVVVTGEVAALQGDLEKTPAAQRTAEQTKTLAAITDVLAKQAAVTVAAGEQKRAAEETAVASLARAEAQRIFDAAKAKLETAKSELTAQQQGGGQQGETRPTQQQLEDEIKQLEPIVAKAIADLQAMVTRLAQAQQQAEAAEEQAKAAVKQAETALEAARGCFQASKGDLLKSLNAEITALNTALGKAQEVLSGREAALAKAQGKLSTLNTLAKTFADLFPAK